ncbi:MAG: ribosome-associated translation inhibitor RaiA [Clostridiales bacterium]|jgi:putative sigma-54 modulation protein|nr:ribosome-associated translation inhibitor RaiA [Clostridiales bacterium]
MKFNYSGKNVAVSERVKEQVEKKIGRVSRVLPENSEIFVTLSSGKIDFKVEITVPLKKRVLRAEASARDAYAAIDIVVDSLDRQMVKYKKRLSDRARRGALQASAAKEELRFAFQAEPYDDEPDEPVIRKSKRISIKPMDPEEAVMEMELLGHGFFVFRNADTDEVNVVYRRSDGYGLIEPGA